MLHFTIIIWNLPFESRRSHQSEEEEVEEEDRPSEDNCEDKAAFLMVTSGPTTVIPSKKHSNKYKHAWYWFPNCEIAFEIL